MKELLIELFCEEIPAMMQHDAEVAFQGIFAKFFEKNNIDFKGLKTYIGPRRITIHVAEIAEKTKPQKIELKGPRVGAPAAAIEGFCRSNNIKETDLVVQKIKDQDFYFFLEESSAKETKNILLSNLHEAISEYVWPKSMYWGAYQIKWVRPLQNILCLFDGEILPFSYGHLTANDQSFGHRFLSSAPLKIKNFKDYQDQLKNNHVILDRLERLDIISSDLASAASNLGLMVQNDPALLEEVAGLAELPVVLTGKIDQKFLSVPSQVLTCSMRTHQKYFSLLDQNGNFAPYFLFVSNMKSEDSQVIINGNEKVLSARLSDALYFYNQDLKIKLEDKLPKLAQIVFHAKLGSLKDKTLRLQELCKYIDKDDPAASAAALLCKSDIASEVVGEFPSLQGVMGYYYAKAQGLSEATALSIRDHYKPLGPSDNVPEKSAGILALADKIDSLCGLMMAGEKPTGSKDPYALRRQALGIIRIIATNNLQINLVELVKFATNLFKEIKLEQEIFDQIILFLEERLKHYLKEQYDISLINGIVDLSQEPDINIISLKLKVFNEFLGTKEGEDLLIVYKRISNIANNQKISGEIKPELFKTDYEINLFKSWQGAAKIMNSLVAENNFVELLRFLASMRLVLADFFDNIMVKDDNQEIAANRLLLLLKIQGLFAKVANFDCF